MNKQRKAKLHARALAYSSANQDRGADSFSFEAGYRAAMRDMRKAIGWKDDHHRANPQKAATQMEHFLRPLR